MERANKCEQLRCGRTRVKADTSLFLLSRYNQRMASRYDKSPFGGVDVWFLLGLSVFLVPFGGLAVGLATGAIHTPN